ncbi:hypothetical protein QOT17_014908 [Balamuthia mandrillaris]
MARWEGMDEPLHLFLRELGEDEYQDIGKQLTAAGLLKFDQLKTLCKDAQELRQKTGMFYGDCLYVVNTMEKYNLASSPSSATNSSKVSSSSSSISTIRPKEESSEESSDDEDEEEEDEDERRYLAKEEECKHGSTTTTKATTRPRIQTWQGGKRSSEPMLPPPVPSAPKPPVPAVTKRRPSFGEHRNSRPGEKKAVAEENGASDQRKRAATAPPPVPSEPKPPRTPRGGTTIQQKTNQNEATVDETKKKTPLKGSRSAGGAKKEGPKEGSIGMVQKAASEAMLPPPVPSAPKPTTLGASKRGRPKSDYHVLPSQQQQAADTKKDRARKLGTVGRKGMVKKIGDEEDVFSFG